MCTPYVRLDDIQICVILFNYFSGQNIIVCVCGCVFNILIETQGSVFTSGLCFFFLCYRTQPRITMTTEMQEIAITEEKPLLPGQADPAKVRGRAGHARPLQASADTHTHTHTYTHRHAHTHTHTHKHTYRQTLREADTHTHTGKHAPPSQ